MTECTLCGLNTPEPPVTDEGVAGTFCCRGCLAVARTFDDPADTDAETTRRAVADGTAFDDTPGETAYLRVHGMHCASCEAFLERRATSTAGVHAADASYPADAMRVRYDPDATAPEAVAAAIDGVGYAVTPVDAEAASGREDEATVGRLLVGGFLGMMVMVWYALFLYPTYFGVPSEALLFDIHGSAGRFLLANVWVLATVVLGYTGRPLLRGAYVALRARRPNMDLLVSLAATTAYLYSTVALLVGRTEVYFDVTVAVVLVVTLGTYYERRMKRRATAQLTDLTRERATTARRVTADGTETVRPTDVKNGDRLVVRAGERVPVDGEVVEGTAAVDESLVTGEALPASYGPGETVRGGTLVTDGRLIIRATSDERTLDRVVSLLWDARSERTPQRLADALATLFVPTVVALGTLAFIVHLGLGAAPTAALLTGLAVLVVSCPCALGLATPLAIAAGTRTLLEEGVVLADGSAVSVASGVDVVALDKTGTLTTGEMTVTDVVPTAAVDRATLLARAAAIEARSDHPVAAAVVDAADSDDATLDRTVTGFETHPGRGVSGRVDGLAVTVGDASLFTDDTVPARLRERYAAAEADGAIAAYVGWAGSVRGVLVARDEPRPGWRAAVEDLAADRRVVVLTGDHGPAASRFDVDGVDAVYAGLPPAGKTETVRRLREEGTVAMVGDGSNDAPALAAADLGIAVASGTELAADAADTVLMSDDLAAVARALDILAATRRRVRENLAWAFCYNAVAVPAAALGVITPLLAAAAMAASSLLVVGNSARSLRPDGPTRSRPGSGDRPAVRAMAATDGGRHDASAGGERS